MRIQHNIMAMNAYRNYTNNTSALSKNLEKLSSGYRINRAGDDAAGLAISEKMRAQITGLNAAQKNVKDGISLVKTAEGATQEIHDMLNRMVDLATQSANGTYQDEVDREAITNEFEQLKSEINRIADSSNFNGIKLLNGDLAATGGATKIETAGNCASKSSGGAAGVYVMDTAIAAVAAAGATNGGTVRFTASTADGTAHVVNFTIEPSEADASKPGFLVAEDGTKYALAKDDGTIAQDELTNAIQAELEKTDLGEQYTMTNTAGKITFTAKEVGTKTPAITSVDIQANYKGEDANDPTKIVHTAMNVSPTTLARDEGREINAADLTLYNGKNYDDAVFTINGHKFVLMTGEVDASALGKDGTSMNATLGLGSDVTILVSDGVATNGLHADDENFQQNIAKIAEVTGLTVTDAVTEATNSNGIDQGKGIRLSAGKGATGGLVLQIGDTSDSYNQLRVSIKDMHVDALGLDKISLGTQKGAQDAVTAIKDAINYVSEVRGTLGATQNRLEHTQNNLSVMQENIQDAESTIRDTDIAAEMMSYTKNNILVQSAQAMLAQANQVPQGVLQLLG